LRHFRNLERRFSRWSVITLGEKNVAGIFFFVMPSGPDSGAGDAIESYYPML
jgi:hypothetical protein